MSATSKGAAIGLSADEGFPVGVAIHPWTTQVSYALQLDAPAAQLGMRGLRNRKYVLACLIGCTLR